MWQLCRWGKVDVCMIFHKHAFDFFYTIAHSFDNFENYATINCQRNVNSLPPTQLPHTFSHIVVILIHNHFESPNETPTNLTFFLIIKSRNFTGFRPVYIFKI
jgi:hypothetical protein